MQAPQAPHSLFKRLVPISCSDDHARHPSKIPLHGSARSILGRSWDDPGTIPRCSRIGQDRSPRSQLPITHASRLGEDLTSEVSFTIPRSRCPNRVFGSVKFRNMESGQNMKWTGQRQERDGPCGKLVWEMQARGSQRLSVPNSASKCASGRTETLWSSAELRCRPALSVTRRCHVRGDKYWKRPFVSHSGLKNKVE
jgi:hypothetical protein